MTTITFEDLATSLTDPAKSIQAFLATLENNPVSASFKIRGRHHLLLVTFQDGTWQEYSCHTSANLVDGAWNYHRDWKPTHRKG